MSATFILITISLFVAAGFSCAFIWSVYNGQLDDDYTPSVRILFDSLDNNEETPEKPKPDNKQNNTN
jgi:cbb3-type cytochrome oxidase maturation protein